MIFLFSCTKDKAPLPGCPQEISFSNDVLPLIQQNCSTSGCHDASASGGYVLTNYSQISTNAEMILSAIDHETGVTGMPLGSPKLSDSLINNFRCWVRQGAYDN